MTLLSLGPHAALIHYAYPATVLAAHSRPALLALLSDGERQRHARFRFESDQDTYLVAHVLVRRVLARVTGAAADAFDFVAGQYGRPEISEPSAAREYRFNLSHTKGLVACAVTRHADIGVDVEWVQRNVELMGVAKHVFSDVEVAALTALSGDAQRHRFFDLWTLKEAYIKAIGKGLSAPLRGITFDPARPDPVSVRFGAEVHDDASSWCMRRFPTDPDHRLALALRGELTSEVHCSEASASDLL